MTAPAQTCTNCRTPLPEGALFCLHCGTATPTDSGVLPPTGTTEVPEIGKLRRAIAGSYRIERALGEGGMAVVYLAEDLKHRRKVAIKVMRSEMAATLGADRFLREVEIAAGLTHPHVLPVFDSGAVDGVLYYVMPYIEGESLQDRIRREGELPVEDALRIAREVAEALAYAHERGIVHRDIKPANIMISRGHALVADFGIARAMDAQVAITKTGLAVGTPQYMSPEQASGSSSVDGRSDIYAMGCVLYEMLVGEPPFTGPNAQAIMSRSLTEAPRPIAVSRAGLPPAIDAVVRKALAKNPADRWQTAQQFADVLARTADAARSGDSSAPVVIATGPSPLQVWGLFGFVTVLTLGLFYGLVSRWGLPVWLLYLAVALLAIGAGVLVVTGQAEAHRGAGRTTPGLARFFTWRNAAIGGGVAMGSWALLLTGLVIEGPSGGASSGRVVRLAVLPFENRGAADQAYIVDGIADQVRGKLMNLPGFQITAQTSSDQYRGTKDTPQQIGGELGVDYLLTSTVTLVPSTAGPGRLQVVPELINVKTGAGMWQQTFDADMNDVLAVQSNIATQVAGALGVALGAHDEQQLAARPTKNIGAWEVFLKGKALTSNDPATLAQAAGYYEQAVALDSSFTEAWAMLSSTLSNLYFNGTPDPAINNRAKVSADRARMLDPDGSLTHYAVSRYNYLVANDLNGAEREAVLAVQRAPNDVAILRQAASLEESLGRWNDALTHLQQARRLDPRSITVGAALQQLLSYTRHYTEALAVGNEMLAIDPANLLMIEDQASTYLMAGDLASARTVIANAPPTLDQPALVAYFGNYQDLYWVLNDAQQQLLLRLTPTAFFDDRAVWADVMMQTWWLRGDSAKARAYADTSYTELQKQLKAVPNDPQRNLFSGLALAYMGRKADAIHFGELGDTLAPLSRDKGNGAYSQQQLIRIYLLTGETDKALDRLADLLKVPYWLSPQWVRIDPTFAALKDNPRFEAILKASDWH
ncbi:MAG: protein kinase domain-containing protein [Gemmatimonadales bacterium]